MDLGRMIAWFLTTDPWDEGQTGKTHSSSWVWWAILFVLLFFMAG
jgi:hypothetical protein